MAGVTLQDEKKWNTEPRVWVIEESEPSDPESSQWGSGDTVYNHWKSFRFMLKSEFEFLSIRIALWSK